MTERYIEPTQEAGRALFDRLACAVCHGGESWSDSATGVMHNVGTIGRRSGARRSNQLAGIDTPPLLNLWQSAPYLHDGSAQDLRTALLAGGWHGGATDLEEAELDLLIAFLLQIDGDEPPVQESVPALELMRPQQDAVYRAGEELVLAVNTTTGLDRVARVQFFVDGRFVAADTTPIYSAVWRTATPGVHRMTAMLEYENGATTTGRPVEILVE